MRTCRSRAPLLLALFLVAGGCEDTAGQPPAGPPARLVMRGGDGQSAAAGSRLDAALEVQVLDAAGRPVPDQPVAWSVGHSAGGSLDVSTTRTSARGRGRAAWTMGAYAGRWSVTAAVDGLAPLTFRATATGPVAVRIVLPAAGLAQDTVAVEAAVTASRPLTAVRATVAGREVALAAAGRYSDGASRWRGALPLEGLPRGGHELLVTAADDRGHQAAALRALVHDALPRLLDLEPVHPPEGIRVLAGRVRVAARCDDDDPAGCASLEVFANGTRVAQGTGAVDALVDVSALTGDSVRFRFEAADSRGARVAVQVPGFAREGSPYWTEVLTDSGFIKAAEPGRSVYVRDYWDELRYYDRVTGCHCVLYRETDAKAIGTLLFPGGVLLQYLGEPEKGYTGISEVGGSHAGDPQAFGSRVRGRWAAWIGGDGHAVRDDVVARSTVTVPNSVGWPVDLDVAEDGTLFMVVLLEGDDPELERYDLLVFRGGQPERVTFDESFALHNPRTDGVNVVFSRTRTQGAASEVVFLGPGGEEVLSPDGGGRWYWGEDPYAAEDGWVAFSRGGQVWTRSPAGEVRRVTPWPPASSLATLGPAGQVVVENGGRWYLAGPGRAPKDIGTAWKFQYWPHVGRVLWIGGALYAIVGTSLFRIDS